MIRIFYKYARNRYLGINQRTQYCHANQNTKEWERWTPIHIFPIETTNSLTCVLINHCHHNKSQQTLLFFVYLVNLLHWLFNYSLWIRYSSLGTNYYFWQHGALVIEKPSDFYIDSFINKTTSNSWLTWSSFIMQINISLYNISVKIWPIIH